MQLLDGFGFGLENYQPALALKADLLRRIKHPDAANGYDTAISQTQNPQERAFLQRRKNSNLQSS